MKQKKRKNAYFIKANKNYRLIIKIINDKRASFMNTKLPEMIVTLLFFKALFNAIMIDAERHFLFYRSVCEVVMKLFCMIQLKFSKLPITGRS